jgi:hypothetical protein
MSVFLSIGFQPYLSFMANTEPANTMVMLLAIMIGSEPSKMP